MKVEITKLNHQGNGIGKINNKVVFVPKTLPNEMVEIDIKEEKKNYCEAKLVNIIKKSNKRIEALCPVFNECGGCQLLNLDYIDTLKFKNEKIQDVFHKYLKINVKLNEIIPCKFPLNYRNKATFQVNNSIGYFKEKSKDLICINKCYISDEKINNIIKIISENIKLEGINQIVIRTSHNTQDIMVILKTKTELNKNEIINNLKKYATSIYINNNLIFGKSKIIERMCDMSFYISQTSFFQVNTVQAEILYNKAIEYASLTKDDTLIDLYCGTGTIGLIASKYAKEVIGIEINDEAIKDANENKKLNNVDNVKFYCGDVGKILKNNNYHPNVVIVDPPRSGLDALAIKQLLNIKSKKIVYVSCDLMTLVRDLKTLSNDYRICEVTPVDMFPYTSHVETVCILERR